MRAEDEREKEGDGEGAFEERAAVQWSSRRANFRMHDGGTSEAWAHAHAHAHTHTHTTVHL